MSFLFILLSLVERNEDLMLFVDFFLKSKSEQKMSLFSAEVIVFSKLQMARNENYKIALSDATLLTAGNFEKRSISSRIFLQTIFSFSENERKLF
jgi:hypothetical protein